MPDTSPPTLRELGYLSEADVASIYNVKLVTLRNWRNANIGPPWTKLQKNLIAYPLDGVRRDLQQRTVTPVMAPTLVNPGRRRASATTA